MEDMKNNNDIRELAKRNGICLWQIADKLNMRDSNFSRMLRTELPSEKKMKIVKIIKELSEKQKQELDDIINQLSE